MKFNFAHFCIKIKFIKKETAVRFEVESSQEEVKEQKEEEKKEEETEEGSPKKEKPKKRFFTWNTTWRPAG